MRKLRNVPIIGVSVLTLAGCGGGGDTSTAQDTVTVEATSSAAEAAPTSIDPSKINPNTWGSVEDVKAFMAEKGGIVCPNDAWEETVTGERCDIWEEGMSYVADYSLNDAFRNRMLETAGKTGYMQISGDTWTITCEGERAEEVCRPMYDQLADAEFMIVPSV